MLAWSSAYSTMPWPAPEAPRPTTRPRPGSTLHQAASDHDTFTRGPSADDVKEAEFGATQTLGVSAPNIGGSR